MPSPDPGALRMIRAASGGRSPIPVLGTSLWLRDVSADAGGGLSGADPFAGTFVCAIWTLSAAGPKSPFVLAFRAAFGAPPDESSALSYDAISALAAAAGRDAHPAASGVQANPAKLGPFRGATGVIQFVAAGATERTLLILRREHDSYTIYERIEPQGIHDFGETDPFMNGN